MEGEGDTNLDRLKDLYAEWARGDFSGHADFFDAEMAAETFGMGDPIRVQGIDEYLAAMRDWLSAWERPIRIEAEEFIESGDKILALVHWVGRGRGSGVEIEGRGAHLWTFRDRRIIRQDTYRDRDEARAALGAG